MTNYNDGKWHGWNGGECPVHPESKVQVMVFPVNCNYGDMVDRAIDWSWDDRDAPIIAFRVIKEHKEPREFWVDPERCIATEIYHSGFIHVREVLE